MYDTILNHPVDRLFNEDVSISINTDARTISNTTLLNEYEWLNSTFKWNLPHFLKCNREAIKHAFTTSQIKKIFYKKLRKLTLYKFKVRIF